MDRPAVTFPAEERHRPLIGTKLYCLVTEAHRCKLAQRLLRSFAPVTENQTHDQTITSPMLHHCDTPSILVCGLISTNLSFITLSSLKLRWLISNSILLSWKINWWLIQDIIKSNSCKNLQMPVTQYVHNHQYCECSAIHVITIKTAYL